MRIDVRERCQRCRKIPRGVLGKANFNRYSPYCSFHCQEWAKLENAQKYINELVAAPKGETE